MTFVYARLVLRSTAGLLCAIWPVCDFGACIGAPCAFGVPVTVNFVGWAAAAASCGAEASPTVSNAAAVSPSTRARVGGRIGEVPLSEVWSS